MKVSPYGPALTKNAIESAIQKGRNSDAFDFQRLSAERLNCNYGICTNSLSEEIMKIREEIEKKKKSEGWLDRAQRKRIKEAKVAHHFL